jgi:alpha-beta hydrolase superfamily lysophospholipase
MQENDFRVPARDGIPLFVRSFLPDPGTPVRAIVQIAHGMAEHSARYARLSDALTRRGYAVYAHDHRGHGRTAHSAEDLGFFADQNGWEKVVDDLHVVLEEAKSRHPGLSVFLLGHSMGSYIARGLAHRRGSEIAALILSGTTHDQPLTYLASRATLVAAERLRLGKRGKSKLLKQVTFDSFNRRIEKPRTSCDWLSRDPAEVDKYINDPLCGFECTTQLWWDVLGGLAEICSPENIQRMPRDLPIYILSGEHDGVHNKLAGIRKLQKVLEDSGFSQLTVRIYPDARHEVFNETNRDEITRDLIAWLDERP